MRCCLPDLSLELGGLAVSLMNGREEGCFFGDALHHSTTLQHSIFSGTVMDLRFDNVEATLNS